MDTTTGTHHHVCTECDFEACGTDWRQVAGHQDATGHTVTSTKDDTDLDDAPTFPQVPDGCTATPAGWCACCGYAPDTDMYDLIHAPFADADGSCGHSEYALPSDPALIVLGAVRSALVDGLALGGRTPKLPAAVGARIRDQFLDCLSLYTD